MATKKSLQAAAATSGLFTAAKEEAPKRNTKEQAKPKPKKETRQQAKPDPEQKREAATFSVKIDKEVLKRWRYYGEANGYGNKGELTERALTEYMNRHKLTPEQEKKIDILCGLSEK